MGQYGEISELITLPGNHFRFRFALRGSGLDARDAHPPCLFGRRLGTATASKNAFCYVLPEL